MGGNAFTSFPSAVGPVGGWVELARTTLGSSSNTITVSSLADKRYYMILCNGETTQTNGDHSWRYNGISTTTYAYRRSNNGVTDFVQTNLSFIQPLGTTNGQPFFDVGYLANLSAKEKLVLGHGVQANSTGSGDTMTRVEYVGKHAQTSNPIDAIQAVLTNGTPNYVTGSEVVVLGWDPADVHTNNFWEELDSTDFSGLADSFTSSTFPAKKYLWVQCYLEGTPDMRPFAVQFNSDTAANYSFRRAHNGEGDAAFAGTTHIEGQGGANVTNLFWNMFIINNSANEKLCSIHSVSVVTQGAGTAPFRDELAGKWTNTSSQITSITVLDRSSGKITTGKLRVWGSD